MPSNIRNFCIISHIDHGKSTLADRFLELTGTVEKRKMQEQILDNMDLERERGITIKLQPVRMTYEPRTNADEETQTYAENNTDIRGKIQNTEAGKLLYKELSYKIRGAAFQVRKKLGLGHKEILYQKALEEEFNHSGLKFEKEKRIDIEYNGKKIGVYQPDFVIDEKIIVEIKALPFIGGKEQKQIWTYLKGSSYKLLLLINFSLKDVDIMRLVYETARPDDEGLRKSALSQRSSAMYQLNLIDTPGHVDFNYEVARSLQAVEGAILLVDATQGVQAQTLANLELAKKANLVIIPAVNKVDLPEANPEETAFEIAAILDCDPGEVLFISAKTGEGVEELLRRVIEKVPPPRKSETDYPRALVFDSFYDDYRGVVAYVRVFDGEIKRGDKIYFVQKEIETDAPDIGAIQLGLKSQEKLATGEIGFIVATLREVSEARVGDTISVSQSSKVKSQNCNSKVDNLNRTDVIPLPGYKEPKSMVYAEIFTSSGEDYGKLRDSLGKLKLSDSSIVYKPSSSTAFGFGVKCGFLGLLHLEIVKERLEREYDLELIVTMPTVDYKKTSDGKYLEPWAKTEVICPKNYLGRVIELVESKRGIQKNIRHLEEKAIVEYEVPLSEIIVNFYDRLKSVTQGYGSLNYEVIEWRESDLVQLDFLIAGEKIDAFSRMVFRGFSERIARSVAERVKEFIPRQNFEVKIQAAIGGKIIAAESKAPFRKDVTEKLYGGDVTRKRKLLEKQKKGKRRMAQVGRVALPTDVFIKLLKY